MELILAGRPERLELRKACMADLDEILPVYADAVRSMERNGIYQWDEIYPDREIIAADINKGEMYIVRAEDGTVAAYTVNKACDLNNHSVLSVCRKAALKEDIAQFNILHGWIMENYHDVDGDGEKRLVEILKDAYNNSKKRKFYNTMLQKADLNILEYKPIVEDRFVPNEFRERIQKEDIPEEMKEALLKSTSDSVAFVNHSINGDFDIPLKWQSKGTQKYIRILEALYDMITSSHVYYLDELGEDLHNDLLYYYLNVFIFNSEKSQLIITSQETTLLSQDLINENRGVVWFVEKNKETASSEYSRGDSFGLHKNLSLYNSYRIGRLGAKPELGSIFINLED